MAQKIGRYSVYLRPMAYLIDLVIISVLALQFQFASADFVMHVIFICLGWFFISLNSNFYKIYRFTKVTRILSLGFLQIILFALIVFSFFGIFHELSRPTSLIFSYL